MTFLTACILYSHHTFMIMRTHIKLSLHAAQLKAGPSLAVSWSIFLFPFGGKLLSLLPIPLLCQFYSLFEGEWQGQRLKAKYQCIFYIYRALLIFWSSTEWGAEGHRHSILILEIALNSLDPLMILWGCTWRNPRVRKLRNVGLKLLSCLPA